MGQGVVQEIPGGVGAKVTGLATWSLERWGSSGKVVHVHIQQEGKQVASSRGGRPWGGRPGDEPHLTFGDSP